MTGRTRTVVYLAIAFGWTWALWIGGWWLGLAQQNPISTSGTIFSLAGRAGSPGFLPQLMFDLAVFGPLLGYLAAGQYRPVWGRPTRQSVLIAVLVPIVLVVPAFILSLASGVPAAGISVGVALAAIATYLASNLVTSGTEEFGWRGYLQPTLRRNESTLWGAAWKVGLIWAVWHYPLMVILYWQLGLVIFFTIAGFTASIVAMAWITGLVYEQSNSIALVALLHALNNTANFALMLIFPTSPFTIVTAAMAWAAVFVLERRYRDHQPTAAAERPER